MCRYNITKTRRILRKNVTTTTEYHTKNCGVALNPDLMCPDTRVYSRIYWYPAKKTESYEVVKCCPGWSNYVINVGCTKRTQCDYVLPQNDNKMCKLIRMKYKAYNRMYYQLTTPISPNDPKRTNLDVIFPTLNQTTETVLKRVMMDKFTSHWFNVYFHGMLKRNNVTQAYAQQTFKQLSFDKIEDYISVYEYFIASLKTNPLPYFKVPLSKPELGIVYGGRWALDKMFVEQRLAGLNPMALQKVTPTGDVGIGFGKLMASLNKTFNWNKAITDAVGRYETLETAMAKGLLFAVDYPIYHDIPHVTDIMDLNSTDNRNMLRSTSPIGIFVVGKDANGKNELKIAAIQMDYQPASKVRTPKDGNKWMVAKAFLQVADFAVVEIYEHLLKTHVRIEPICICIHRHLPPKHPLYMFLKIHCRGLIPTNSYGFPRLTNEQMYMHRLFGMGHIGTLQILNNGYLNMKWKDNDLLVNIKARGVDDREILPYYPYRDDGKVIYDIIDSFSKDLVDLYYKSDDDVVNDDEIQSLVNELSADGTGTVDSGKGKIVGFPAKLTSKEELSDIIKQVIWLVVQHAAVNYPIMGYGSFTPNMPTKLYEDPDHKDYGKYLSMLPRGHISVLQTFVTLNLGTMRYDKMFDYSNLIEEGRGKLLVDRYFQQMSKEIQPILQKRNEQRLAQGHLTYPYLEPKWLPNSIHT